MNPNATSSKPFRVPWRYLWFITWNWGISLAYQLWKDEKYGQKKYQLFPASQLHLNDLTLYESPHQDHTIFIPVSYRIMEQILDITQPLALRHIVDVGAGEGRALAVAAYHGFTQLTGIEVHSELAPRARLQLADILRRFPGTHATMLPSRFQDISIAANTDLLFLFNPFGEQSINELITQINQQVPSAQALYIAYVNPVWLSSWIQRGYTLLKHEKTGRYFEFAILQRNRT